MDEYKYEVYIGTRLVASNMTIETALILCKALFTEYYNDHAMTVMIQEMEIKADKAKAEKEMKGEK